MKFSFAGATDRGKVRKKNEDCFVAKRLGDDEYLFIVADGMGGHLAGEIASSLACKIVEEFLTKKTGERPLLKLLEAFEWANQEILREGKKSASTMGMGTTLTTLYLKNSKAYIAHVGDSRVYMIKEGRILKLTKDHSLVEKLLMEGSISAREAKNHPKKNILYESVGVLGEIHPQLVGPLDIEGNEIFVLCSDGLNLHLSDEEIKEIAEKGEAEDAVKTMIKTANERGGKDNITAIIVKGDMMKQISVEEQEEARSRWDWLTLAFVVLIYISFLLGGLLIQKKAESFIIRPPSSLSVK